MSDKMQVACPHCNANLKVPLQMQGKVVACPKCKQQFRIGELEVPAEEAYPAPTFSQSQSFSQPQSASSGSMDLFSDLGPAQPANSGFDYGAPVSSGQAPGAGWGGGNSSHSPYSPPPARAAKQRASNQPMSDSDNGLQRTGFFFIALPALAAVLPFFGLQLKILAAAGEFACLIAMVLGLIGAGLIFFARRNQADFIISGLGAGLFVMFFGIGGFLLQSFLMGEEEVAEAPRNGGFVTPDPAIQDQLARQQAAQAELSERMAETRRRMHEQMFEESPATNNGFPANNGFPTNNGPPANNNNFNRPPTNNNNFNNNNFSPPAPGVGAAGGFPDGKNLFEGELVENGGVISELMRQSSLSMSHFMRSNRPGKELDTTHTLSNMVGKTARMGRLHDDKPVTHLCAATLGRELLLLPIAENETRFKYVIRPDAGEQIVGLRLAFDNEAIVGIQGLVQAGGSGAPRELEWLGRSTEDVQMSMNPSPGESGMVCYSEAGRFVGFAWVTRN